MKVDMTQTHRTAPKYVIGLAQQFRREPTAPEAFLWECLRDRKFLGFKFRRQHPIGRYIADLFCSEAGLVIELDGEIHNGKDRAVYDRIRDEELSLRGLEIIHIKNDHITEQPEKTMELIASLLPLSSRERGYRGEGA